tara:strand:- start:1635 stop:2543 length:909 start_codon:yes stop_codon:yes gene_type:complete
MRVAVCVSGSLRQFKSCYENLVEHLFSVNGCEYDFFLSSWDSKIRHHKVDFEDEGTFEEAISLYKPKKYNYEIYNNEKRNELANLSGLIEHQRKYGGGKSLKRQFKHKVTGGWYAHNYIGQLYNIYKANELKKDYEKENNFKYDLSIRIRYDAWVTRGGLTKTICDNIKEDEILVSEYLWQNKEPWTTGPDDKFAIGTSESMDMFSSMYTNFPKLLEQHMKEHEAFIITHPSIVRICENNKLKLTKVDVVVQVYYKLMGYKFKGAKNPNLNEELKAIKSATKIAKDEIFKNKIIKRNKNKRK